MQPTLNGHLLERVLARDNLQSAWKQVKKSRGAPGVDGVTIEDYSKWAQQHWLATRRGLERDYYIPSPVKRVTIPKPQGGDRHLESRGRPKQHLLYGEERTASLANDAVVIESYLAWLTTSPVNSIAILKYVGAIFKCANS